MRLFYSSSKGEVVSQEAPWGEWHRKEWYCHSRQGPSRESPEAVMRMHWEIRLFSSTQQTIHNLGHDFAVLATEACKNPPQTFPQKASKKKNKTTERRLLRWKKSSAQNLRNSTNLNSAVCNPNSTLLCVLIQSLIA